MCKGVKYFKIHEVAHQDMNVHNNYTLIGYRHQCYTMLSFYGSGAGFIIEPWFMNKSVKLKNLCSEESKTEKEDVNLKDICFDLDVENINLECTE
jgi:hypothetical protein